MQHSRLVAAASAVLFSVLASAACADSTPVFEPYGFVRLDAIYDDSRMSNVQFPFWVESEPDGMKNDRELSIHPRLSRVGVRLAKMEVGDGVTAAGQVEIDFQNGGRESREVPRMRHAFVQFSGATWDLLAGQTGELISPLYPAANNDGMMWNAGNTGDRRPQLRVTWRPSSGGAKPRFAVAAGMPNAVDGQDLDGDGQLDGQDAAVPVVQGLAEIEASGVLAGVWAHGGVERVNVAGDDVDFTSTLFGGHLRVPLGRTLTLAGEGFVGRNASDVRAGIGQGIHLAAVREIATAGGFVEAAWRASDAWALTVGAGLDQPREEDLADGARRRNSEVWAVQHFRPWQRTVIGLEWIHWETEYVDRPIGIANRIATHITFNF